MFNQLLFGRTKELDQKTNTAVDIFSLYDENGNQKAETVFQFKPIMPPKQNDFLQDHLFTHAITEIGKGKFSDSATYMMPLSNFELESVSSKFTLVKMRYIGDFDDKNITLKPAKIGVAVTNIIEIPRTSLSLFIAADEETKFITKYNEDSGAFYVQKFVSTPKTFTMIYEVYFGKDNILVVDNEQRKSWIYDYNYKDGSTKLICSIDWDIEPNHFTQVKMLDLDVKYNYDDYHIFDTLSDEMINWSRIDHLVDGRIEKAICIYPIPYIITAEELVVYTKDKPLYRAETFDYSESGDITATYVYEHQCDPEYANKMFRDLTESLEKGDEEETE